MPPDSALPASTNQHTDALGWIALRRDVHVVGDDGSGKSRLLRQIGKDARERGLNTVLLAAAPLPGAASLSPFRLHDLSASKRSTPSTEAEIVHLFTDELTGRRSLLLVDDADSLDDASLHVLGRLLTATDAHFVATTALNGLDRSPLLRSLFSVRAPARVEVAALDFAALSQLLGQRLGGRPSARLVGRVLTASCGNPRVAEAIVDAGRWRGAVTVVDGVWTDADDLLSGELDAVRHALGDRLVSGDLEALRTLASAGTLDRTEAARHVGAERVARLIGRGRLLARSPAEGALIRVSPPALAAALRATPHGPGPAHPETVAEQAVGRIGLSGRGAPDATLRQAIDAVPFAVDAAHREREESRLTWSESRQMLAAIRHLITITDDDGLSGLATVFDTTAPSAADSEDTRVRFAILTLTWLASLGEIDGRRSEALLADPDLTEADRAGLARLRSWLRGDHVSPRRDGGHETWDQGITAALRPFEATLLLDAGFVPEACARARTALALTESEHDRALLELLLTDGRILLDDVTGAEEWARECLASAVDALSVPLMRAASLGLARTLWFLGDATAAWSALMVALRLGPSGPFDSLHGRVLALAAVVQSTAENRELAVLLSGDLESQPGIASPPYDDLRAYGEAVRSTSPSFERLWATGSAMLDRGQAVKTVNLWLFAPGVPAPMLRKLRTVAESTQAPLLHRFAALKESLATDDQREIVTMLAEQRTPLPPPLAAAAAAAVAPTGGPFGATSVVPTHRGPAVARGGRHDLGHAGPSARLSTREREVAVLASRGRSNKEIAIELSISVRTVENHMYRLLGKLGMGGRSELVNRW